jgi:hypothetical protein
VRLLTARRARALPLPPPPPSVINDTLQPVDFLGPFDVLDSETLGAGEGAAKGGFGGASQRARPHVQAPAGGAAAPLAPTPDNPWPLPPQPPPVGLPRDTDYSQYFFAYICRKRRLTLPLHPEQRQRLPHGWVRSSRAMLAK